MNEFFSGEYVNAIDAKGRIMLPAKLRNAASGERLVLTRGFDDCLSLFPHSWWGAFLEQLFGKFSLLEPRFRLVQRRIIASAQECSLTASGRLLIPKPLLAAAGLQPQKECTVLGMHQYIEIWDLNRYQSYLTAHDQEFVDAAEELGRQLGGLLNRV